MQRLLVILVSLVIGCHASSVSDDDDVSDPPLNDDDVSNDDDSGDSGDDDDASDDDDSGDDDDSAAPCPEGVVCFAGSPYYDTNDTTLGASNWSSYGCSPGTDEAGPEIVYRFELTEPAFVTAVVRGMTDADIDVHLLGSMDPDDCVARGHFQAAADLGAGTWYVVTDSWVGGDGTVYSGDYTLAVSAWAPPWVDCAMATDPIDRIGDGGTPLAMPATGPIVLEAHLVTVDDGYGTAGTGPWPATITEGIPNHYLTSEAETGWVMHRTQSWAPQESSDFGQGAHYSKLPNPDEAWYVNMMWASRPAAGTKMILMDATGRAAVVAAGYETGPGNLDRVGGTVEEVHHWFGTGHGDELTLGFAVDQTLPLGPVECL